MKKQAKKAIGKKDQQPYRFSDEATQNKIKKHLTDIKDVITEKDIANVKVPGKENDPVTPSEMETETIGDSLEFRGNKTVKPWDTLEE